MNAELIDNFAQTWRRRPLFEPVAADVREIGPIGVKRLLPHRHPFLFVDRITAVDLNGPSIAGERHIDPGDPVFEGHFPGDPIYPGVLQLETMGQLGLCLFALLRRERMAGEPVDVPAMRAVKIHHAAFREPVLPGDDLAILARVIEWDEYMGVCGGQLLRGGTVCSFGVMEVFFVEA
jgi:3-hydroxyacyl-[acyl-carrier-protein] dehydratase